LYAGLGGGGSGGLGGGGYEKHEVLPMRPFVEVPGAHGKHVMLFNVAANVFTWHSKQYICPVVFWYVPAGHGNGAVAFVTLIKEPGGAAKHEVLLLTVGA